MNIFVSGSLAYDRIMTFPGRFEDHLLPDKLHILNVCFLVDGLVEKFGGTAGNIAYSLALLGENPRILATAGDDFGRYEQWLTSHGLDLSGVKKIPGALTAGAYITTDKANNQITAFHPAAMNFTSDYGFMGVDPRESLAVAAPGCLADMQAYCRRYREMGLRYIFDPGQNIPAFSGPDLVEMITGSEILISNDYELEMIRQSTGLSRPELLSRTRTIITTLGEEGALVVTPGQEIRVPAARVSRVADPTGAGDAFRSGLIKGLVQGRDIADAARVGATAAAYAVEKHGTQEHAYTEEEFWLRYKENYG